MSGRRYTVGEVSRISGVPKDTLLYYDRIGLFKPKFVNPDTRYRYYTHDQFWQLDIIIACRNLNIPLVALREILEARDNGKIVELMRQHQEYARNMSRYYEQVDRDIDWYAQQYELARNADVNDAVRVECFPEKRVIYAEDREFVWEYHVRMIEASRHVLAQPDSFRRCAGFVMDPAGLEKNNFMKLAEYAEYFTKENAEVDPACIRVLPGGDYACCTVNVVHRQVDFSRMNRWLSENGVKPQLVLMEEIAFQMFEYFGQGYPCKLCVKIS